MTEAEFTATDTIPEKVAEDIHMAAINLNTALHQFKRTGGDLKARPVLMRLLAQTELFLNASWGSTPRSCLYQRRLVLGNIGRRKPVARDQSAYDTGYREQQDGNKPETNLLPEEENQ